MSSLPGDTATADECAFPWGLLLAGLAGGAGATLLCAVACYAYNFLRFTCESHVHSGAV